ncbi:MAG: hypothetical protein ACRCTD_08670 [Beijerinckiaceae bacterium]
MMYTGTLYGYARATQNSADLMRNLRQSATDLQRQMATGKKSETYSGLGIDRRKSLDIHSRLSTLEGFQNTIRDTKLQIQVMDQSLSRLDKMALDAKSMARPGSYQPDASGRAIAQWNADENLKFAVDLLNADIGGRYLFSGRSSDIRPVVSFDEMINGTAGRAGVKQMVMERETADLGTGLLGRLSVPALAGATVSLERDGGNPGAMFGFTLTGIATDSPTINVAGPAGALQTVSANFIAQPQDGAQVSVTMALPDGSQETLTLYARQSPPTPPQADTFQIGATPAATAANFQAALLGQLQKAASSSLRASSAIVASTEFFKGTDANPPQRVPAPAASAAALVTGTTANTVIWYRGDADTLAFPDARNTATAQIGESQAVGVGARANEEGIQQSMAMFAAMSVLSAPSSDATARDRYEELADRVRQGLSFPGGMQEVKDISAELAMSLAAINTTGERHGATKNILVDTLADVENADTQEVAAALLEMQTRLQATYSVTATLSQLSLTQFLR